MRDWLTSKTYCTYNSVTMNKDKKDQVEEAPEAEKEPTPETTEAAVIEPVEGRRDGNGALIIG